MHQGHAAWLFNMYMQHGQAAWSCDMDMLHRHAGHMRHKHEAELQHGLAAWTSRLICIMDMQHEGMDMPCGQAAWTSSMDKQHVHAAWTFNMYMQHGDKDMPHGHSVWTCSMYTHHVQAAWRCILDMQYAHRTNKNKNAKIFLSPSNLYDKIKLRHKLFNWC